MSAPRRRIIRPLIEPISTELQRQRQLQKLRSRLDHERGSLARWQTRLKRAFTTVEKHQKKIARLEKQITNLED